MAVDSKDNLRLSFLEDVLPVGMAVIERVRKGGASKVIEAFNSAEEPLEALRIEGESAAKAFRDRLDKISPGLGNPVVPVEVAVEISTPNCEETLDQACLMECLERIKFGIDDLEHFLVDDSLEHSTATQENQ